MASELEVGKIKSAETIEVGNGYAVQFGGTNYRLRGSNSGGFIALDSAAGESLKIDSSGNVKIGSSSAADTQLSVECDTTGEAIGDGIRIQNAHGVNNDIAPIYFGVHGGTRRAKAAIGLKRTGSYGIGELRFAVDSNSTDTDVSFATDTKLTIDSAGLATFSGGITVSGGFTSLGSSSELTVASGEITVTSSVHTVDTEGDAASDDLYTINGGSDGSILTLMSITGTRQVTLKDAASGTNLRLAGDFTLSSSNDTITLMKKGTVWREISRSDNA